MGMIKLPSKSTEFFKANLDEIFGTGYLAEGPWNKRLSELVQQFTGALCAIPTASNGSGLMALLHLYRELRGKTAVLIQSNTMYGVKTLVTAGGMDLVGYIDCDPRTLMPSVVDVETALHQHADHSSLVILLSHIGGIVNPDMVAIASLCDEHEITLIEDCAHSFGATLQGRHSGTLGDAGVYSFYATKAVPAGEGGVAVTNDEEIGEALRRYVMYDRFDQVLNIGVNIRQSEVQALLVYSVAKEMESIIADKTVIAAKYIEACEALNIDFIRQDGANSRGNYYKFIVRAESGIIADTLPALTTVTSPVYDYCLGRSHIITTNHACLPIWYLQPSDLTSAVIDELEESSALRQPG